MMGVDESPLFEMDETARLEVLYRYKMAISSSEHNLNDIAELACQIG